MADALAGNTTGDYIITKWALGDDEIDYSLYDEAQPTNLRGRVIENMPVLESVVHTKEQMNYFITDAPEMVVSYEISNIPTQITLEGEGDLIVIDPVTDNLQTEENYEFILEHDHIATIYDVNTPPVADFFYGIDNQGSLPLGSPPSANFNWQNTDTLQ